MNVLRLCVFVLCSVGVVRVASCVRVIVCDVFVFVIVVCVVRVCLCALCG